MRIKTVTIILVNIALFVGCTDQTSHKTTSIIENLSGHQVKVSYYKIGRIDPDFNMDLSINESTEVLVSAENGKGVGLTYPVLLQGAAFDSAIVEFNSSRKAVHYGFNKTGRNPNAILFDNPGNIFHPDSYVERIILETKKRDEREFKFTFTEEDYSNAK